jgi:hypothetical protein
VSNLLRSLAEPRLISCFATDVREPSEVALGSIPSSVNLPLQGFEKSLSLDEGELLPSYSLCSPAQPRYILADSSQLTQPICSLSPPLSISEPTPTHPIEYRRLHPRPRFPQAREDPAHHLLLPRRRARSNGRGSRKEGGVQVVSFSLSNPFGTFFRTLGCSREMEAGSRGLRPRSALSWAGAEQLPEGRERSADHLFRDFEQREELQG